MPKLSAFIGEPAAAAPVARIEEEPADRSSRAATPVAPRPEGSAVVRKTAPPSSRPDLGMSRSALEELNRNRVFRWPDGSLRPDKPPAKKNVVLARREWEDIVNYCRRNGGCQYCTAGACLLHGFGVSQQEHEAYLKEIGLWNQPLQDLRQALEATTATYTQLGNLTLA